MIKITKQILKKALPFFIYNIIKIIYKFLKDYKSRNYDLLKDLEYNENLFKKFNINISKIKSKLNSLNLSYENEQLSWHYHLFIGLKDYFKNQKINILEIGTHDGTFTNFISKIYSNCQITTIDLDEGDKIFINTYNRDDKKKLNQFLKLRKNNLNRYNINFIKLNSINIEKYFHKKKFDLIWVDGDHLNPQVTIDIVNSLALLTNKGIICTDDVIMNTKFKKSKYISNESFLTLKHFENNKILKNYYLIKRIIKSNFFEKKYISISTFNNNFKFPIN